MRRSNAAATPLAGPRCGGDEDGTAEGEVEEDEDEAPEEEEEEYTQLASDGGKKGLREKHERSNGVHGERAHTARWSWELDRCCSRLPVVWGSGWGCLPTVAGRRCCDDGPPQGTAFVSGGTPNRQLERWRGGVVQLRSAAARLVPGFVQVICCTRSTPLDLHTDIRHRPWTSVCSPASIALATD